MNDLLFHDVHIRILYDLSTPQYLIMRLLNNYYNNLVLNNILSKRRILKLHYTNITHIPQLLHITNLFFDIELTNYTSYSTFSIVLENCARIICLNLIDSYTFPLERFTNLEYLYIDNCKLNDKNLYGLTSIKTLIIKYNVTITGESISTLTNLTHLAINGYNTITSLSISLLTNLTTFSAMCKDITNEGVSMLTNIRELSLYDTNIDLTNFSELTRLKLIETGIDLSNISTLIGISSLKLCNNPNINSINSLTNITHLNLCCDDTLQSDGIIGLSNITHLNLGYNSTIQDWGIKNMTNITKLSLGNNSGITDGALKCLCNITDLNLSHNSQITNDGIKYLSNLSRLKLACNTRITRKGIRWLKNIVHLDISCNSVIFGIEKLTQLRSLVIYRNKSVTDYNIQSLTNLTALKMGDSCVTYNGVSKLVELGRIYMDYTYGNIFEEDIKLLASNYYKNTGKVLKVECRFP